MNWLAILILLFNRNNISSKELEKIIPDAGLIVLPNSTHYAYLENLPQVINILNNFL